MLPCVFNTTSNQLGSVTSICTASHLQGSLDIYDSVILPQGVELICREWLNAYITTSSGMRLLPLRAMHHNAFQKLHLRLSTEQLRIECRSGLALSIIHCTQETLILTRN